MILLKADERQACARVVGRITTSSVGIPVELELSDDFDGLAVTICFECGDSKADVVWYDGAEVTVPSQLLAHEGERLKVGVYGARSDGEVVIPTVWATADVVRLGAVPSGVSPSDPEPDWTAQVQSIAAEAIETANSVREDADAGRFDGFSPSASVTKSGDTATITITDKDGTTTASVTDGATGPQGPRGETGPQGPKGDTGAQGPAGADGYSPTVTVQPITGGHEVTVTDADGSQSFDVMDGKDGGQKLTKTLTGTTLTAQDAYAAPPVDATVYGASEQDGTPSPSAPVPIDSVDALVLEMRGKNLLPALAEATTVNGVTFAPNADGSVHVYGTATAAATALLTADGRIDNSGASYGGDLLTLGGADGGSSSTYCLRVNYYTRETGGGSNHVHYVTDEQTLSRANNTWYWANIYIYVASGATVDATVYPQLERGTEATGYEPYCGTSTPIDLQGHELRSLPDGTRDELTIIPDGAAYRVTLTQRVMHSELTEDVSEDLSLADSPNSYGIYNNSLTLTQAQFNDLFPNRTVSNSYVVIGECSIGVSNRGAAAGTTIAGITAYTSTRRVYLRTNTHQDASTIAAMFAHGPIEIDYAGSEPIIHDLGTVTLPSLPAPNMTVWADGGSATPSLSLTYERDINIVLADMQSEVDHVWAQLAPVEQPIATANHAAGTYLVLDGTFCKVTTAIAIGETVEIGTNVAATTVAAELLAIQA